MTGLEWGGTTRPSCCHMVLRATGGVGWGCKVLENRKGGSQLSLGQGEGSWEAPQMQHLDWVLYSQGGGIVQAADTP